MLVLRLNRTGRRNKPYFRLVVQEKTVAPGGRHVEVVGSWDPHMKKGTFKAERIQHWIGQGAQTSISAHNLLVTQGVIEGEKRAVKMKRPEVKVEEPVSEEAAEEKKEESVEESPAQEAPKEEVKEEAPAEEKKEEATPAEEKSEEKKEEKSE